MYGGYTDILWTGHTRTTACCIYAKVLSASRGRIVFFAVIEARTPNCSCYKDVCLHWKLITSLSTSYKAGRLVIQGGIS
jgi:hypothetical protein